ncbi:MAG: hypothetical protein CL844_07140, partial [Crocinitomicaceae bacterium]|nr:hypothetical protein [Crocinitomicaceae bacterium]
CNDIGTNNVTLTVDDGNGNSSSCIATVTVIDTIPPTAICQDINIYLDASGNASISANDIDNGSFDNCGNINLSVSNTNFTCSDIGPNNVTLTVDDGNGNSSLCTAIVIVIDTITPTAICQDINIYLDASGNTTISASDIDGGSFDSCGNINLSASNTNFTCNDIGANNVTLTVDDGNGNSSSCTAIVTVIDTISPTAICQDINVYLDASGNVSIAASDIDGGSFDNCGIDFGNFSINTGFDCADIGANNVTLTINDDNGNSSSCIAIVTVIDSISPTTICQDINVYLDPSGNASISASDIDNGSFDNCGNINLSASNTNFTCNDIGPNSVTLNVDDGNGNSSSCTAIVTVIDTIIPIAICQDINVFLDASGNASITASDIDGGSTDNCSVNFNASNTTFSCLDLGPNNVTLTVDDGNGNSSSCIATVTVIDTIPPTAICQDVDAYLDASGNILITETDINGGSFDNCDIGVGNISITAAFTCVDVGPNNVMLTIEDNSGNTSSCTAIVTVIDSISPTAICQDINVYLDASGNASISASDIDGGSFDNCANINLSASNTNFTCNDIGANNVILTVDDGNGNSSSCIAIVTVIDTIPPTAICQDISVYLNNNGDVSITPNDIDGGSFDNCGTVNISHSTTIFNCNDVGQNNVTLTVDDGNGNISSCIAIVTVIDTISPIIICPNNIVISNGSCNATNVNLGNPIAIDNCLISSITNNSPTIFPLGITNVIWTATDNNGNIIECSQTVTVIDTIAPTAICQNINAYLDLSGNVSITANDIDGGSFDNCGNINLSASNTNFTCTNLGDNNITLTVTDINGNASACGAIVTVIDTISPTAICQDINVFLDASGNISISANDIDGGSFDNCGNINLSASNTNFTCTEVGPNNITLNVDDGNGNTSSCTAIVTVIDTISPNAVCQDITVYIDVTGNVSITANDINGGSSSNCGNVNVNLFASNTNFTCADIGNNNVTLTVGDGNGNSSSCTAIVTVIDSITPILTCPPNITLPNDPGMCSASIVNIGQVSSQENCSIASITNNGIPSNIYPVGITDVIWTTSDLNGNTSQCLQTITIIDNEDPMLPVINDINVECSASIPIPAAIDNCAGIVLGNTTDPLIYNTLGSFIINWTFDDGNGNVIQYAQNITVDDSSAPLVEVPLPDVFDQCSVTLTSPIANDECIGPVIGTTSTIFPITSQGTTVVTWIYTDNVGNTSSQTQNVIINDTTLPIVDSITLPDIISECEVNTLTPPTATDNCAGVIIGTTNINLPIITQGITQITWIYDDGNGNIISQNQNVIISDISAPVPDIINLPTITNECNATVIAPTATDACNLITIIGTTTDPVTYTNQGTYTITWTYTDASGNTSSQTQDIVINDITPPVPDVTNLPDVTEICSAMLMPPSATDNCAGIITGTTSTIFPITSSTIITWTYDDGNGNVSTQDQIITISGVDVTTTTNITEIIANNSNANSYQWIDCNNGNVPVADGTNQNYIAKVNGSYAVVINQNGCVDTSDCITINSVGIETMAESNINIYPNPVLEGIFNIVIDGESIKDIKLQDIQGRIIKILFSNGTVNVSNLAKGKYFVKITTETNKIIVKSIIIQ